MPTTDPVIDYSRESAQFAARVRHLRQRAQLTLQELAARCGLAASTLSKMENGQLSPSYETLLRLANGLQVDVGELFSAAEQRAAAGRRSITRRGSGVVHSSPQYRYEMLSAELSRKAFVPLVTTIKARSLDEFPALPNHEGEEFIYVISGTVEVHTEHYEPTQLHAGDSCYLDSSMGHACLSKGRSDAVVVWIASCLQQPLAALQSPPVRRGRPRSRRITPAIHSDESC